MKFTHPSTNEAIQTWNDADGDLPLTLAVSAKIVMRFLGGSCNSSHSRKSCTCIPKEGTVRSSSLSLLLPPTRFRLVIDRVFSARPHY